MKPASFLRQAFLMVLLAFAAVSPAHAQTAPAQTIWRLLDYIAVDYSGAVAQGRVINEAEYVEMVEFSASVRQRLAQLPPTTARASLVSEAETLQDIIAAKAPPLQVAISARALGRDLLAAYPVPLAPPGAPDLARGAALYAEHCSSCHGASGNGRGLESAGMDPPPSDFTDRARARERSVFALYQVIEQGLEGTAMESFAHLPVEDRWALAFHVGRYAYPEQLAARGQQVWANPRAQAAVPDMRALVSLTTAQLEQSLGSAEGTALTAFLRGKPQVLGSGAERSLGIARDRLQEALAAYEVGHFSSAEDLALAAYLDGFEPVEPILTARNGALMRSIEAAMAELRSRIDDQQPVSNVRQQVDEVLRLLDDAETEMAPENASSASSFIGAFTVLLREGLEALLIVIAMMAFLRKAERQDAMRYVYGGWIAALLAGAATWLAATYLISISGASRELTEGFGSLFAAIVLLSVGIWMHGKAQAGAWQRYIAERMSAALSQRSLWFLFGLTFVVVYREVFETILFYTALWTDGNGGAVAGGAVAATVLLAIIAVAMLRYSRQLPISTFFTYSSILIAILAVVLAGKGIGGLQEGGIIDVTPFLAVPHVDMLGLIPTRETVIAQILTAAALAAGFWLNWRAAQTARAA